MTRRVTGQRPTIDVAADAAVVAARIADIIRTRVRSGRDINDHPFAPYAPTYAAQNGSAVVDLDSGQAGGLLDTLRVATSRPREGVAVVTVTPAPQHARAGTYLHTGTPTMRARPWLGLSPRDLQILERLLRA